MSELTTCNFCLVENIRARAKYTGKKVTIRPALSGGQDIYVHPATVKIPKNHVHQDYGEEEADTYWVAWVMRLTDSCCC